jgi:hypothetical protein
MATTFIRNASQWLQSHAAEAQQYLAQGAIYDQASDSLVWPTGHANDSGGGTSGNGGTSTQTSAGSLQTNPGYEYDILEFEKAADLKIQQINNDFTKKQNDLNRQFTRQQAESDRALESELQAKRISSSEYMQQRDLAQRETEFARTLALQTLVADRDFQLSEAQLELDRVAEIRQERLLQAQLAANPQDFVAYEFYKRSLGDPQDLAMAQSIQDATQEQDVTGELQTGPDQVTATAGEENLLGTPYPEAQPAYSDQTLQMVINAIQGGGGQGGDALYNPNLGGTGAFGAEISSPNKISRKQGTSLSTDEMGILSSFLRAGVDVGGGKMVGLNPDEYFKQVEQSWVPTFSGAGGFRTNYS